MRRTQFFTVLFVFVLLFGFAAQSRAQSWSGIINPSRAVDWSRAGIPGGIPNRTAICATLNPGASGTQISNAIQSCPAGQVVFLNSGTYNISDQGIDFANTSGVTLRGAGANKTFLIFTASVGCGGQNSVICLENGDNSWEGGPSHTANWTGGYAKGTTVITLDTTSGLSVGSVIILDQLDDSTDTGDIFNCQTSTCTQEGGSAGRNGARAQTQFVKVTSISGNNVTISPGLYMPNWRSSQSPGAWWASTQITMSGVENLSIDNTNSGVDHGITLNNAYNCWVTGVRSIDPARDHVNLYQAAASVIQSNYFYGTQNAVSQSYGVEPFLGSDNVIVNNILQKVTTPIQLQDNSGSVFAYNYNINDYYVASANWMIYGESLHTSGNSNLLFEGNEGNGFIADNIHGQGQFNTLFRNQYFGWEVGKSAQTTPIDLYVYNRFFNIIGNVLGKSGYHTQYQDIPPNGNNGDQSIYALGWSGNEGAGTPADSLVVSTLMRWGNYDTVSNAVLWNVLDVPSSLSLYGNPLPVSQALPASFFLSKKPSWWGSMPFPAVGPDVTGGNIASLGGHAYLNPAQACYNSMGGPSDGTGNVLSFNASTCYSSSVAPPPPPAPPTNVTAVPH